MKTICYIDGLNLFYRALKGTPYKWLDIEAFIKKTLPVDAEIILINYYTSRVSGKLTPDAPANQNAYLRAVSQSPLVKTHYGNFLSSKKWAGLVKPPQFRPEIVIENNIEPDVAFTWKVEEKGSDVNLGVHLVRDAALNKMDTAVILTNDTDLAEAMRIAKDEFNKNVILLTPSAKPSRTLMNVANETRFITRHLPDSQFPNEVILSNGKTVKKPQAW